MEPANCESCGQPPVEGDPLYYCEDGKWKHEACAILAMGAGRA